MEVKELVSKLEKSKKFKDFKKKNPGYYLVHAFFMATRKDKMNQLGYYSKKTDKVVVFDVGRKITQEQEQEVLKKTKKEVRKLDLSKVRLEPEGAMKIAINTKDKKHGNEAVTKEIAILQNLSGKEVYNITLITSNFNIINIRISAATGKVLKQSKQSIMSLGKTLV